MSAELVHTSLYNGIATSHGLAGLTIFLTGILQFIMKKGGTVHRIIGRIYNYSWIIILTTGAYIGSPIIVAIVLMGFYLSVTGVRLAVVKGKPFENIDKSILIIAVFIVLFMIYSAIYFIVKQNLTMAIISSFFALLYSFVLTLDIAWNIFKKRIINPKQDFGKMSWYISHLSRMQFSFITAVGAFTAVQNLFDNTVLNFILPAFIGFIAVIASRKYFIKKLNLEAENI